MKRVSRTTFLKLLITFLLLVSLAFGSFALADEITDVHTIKMVQAALNSAGYECGTVDGVVGNKTRGAIEKLQASKSLDVDGQITEVVVAALGITDEMLKGAVFEDFVQRYNEAVVYLNDISSQTGDPTIHQITKEELSDSIATLDGVTNFQLVTDERNIAISGCSLSREANKYDIPMVYELVSSSYAMDDSFISVNDAIEFLGSFVENKSAETEKMNYGIWNHGGTIYITVIALP